MCSLERSPFIEGGKFYSCRFIFPYSNLIIELVECTERIVRLLWFQQKSMKICESPRFPILLRNSRTHQITLTLVLATPSLSERRTNPQTRNPLFTLFYNLLNITHEKVFEIRNLYSALQSYCWCYCVHFLLFPLSGLDFVKWFGLQAMGMEFFQEWTEKVRNIQMQFLLHLFHWICFFFVLDLSYNLLLYNSK